MPRKKAEEQNNENIEKVTPNDQGWTDYVLELLAEDEKIMGNPTTDGLRRIFEIALDCVVTDSSSQVVQCPDPHNEKRATVVHSMTYVLNDSALPQEIKKRTVNGAADVYWGNCDKVFRNHPVAVAETRAEGRALRRGLKLRKVVAAEEIAEDIEDDPNGNSVSKISTNQINFIDVLSKRLNVDVLKLLNKLDISSDSVYNIKHEEAVGLIRQLNSYQQNTDSIPTDITGYIEWK